MKKFIAIIALVLTQFAAWTDSVSGQERILRGSNGRNRVPTRLVATQGGVPARTASHLQVQPGEMIVDEQVMEAPMGEGEYIVDEVGSGIPSGSCGCDSCGGGGCDSCSVGSDFGCCTSCSAPRRFCICLPSHGWVHAEYLMWYQNGMNAPPLVTTSPAGTARNLAGVLAPANNATVLYGGNNDILTDIRNGGRIRFGWWLDRWPGLGIEGEYVGLAQDSEDFFLRSNAAGSPILARPYIDATTGLPASQLVSYATPAGVTVLAGSIATQATTQLNGAAVRFRKQLTCSTGCGYSDFLGQSVPTSSRLDATLGYRYWELQESLRIQEQLTTSAPDSGTFDIVDRFGTRNQFNGAELGFLWQGRRGWWSLDALMRVGLGNVHQTVDISGRTIAVDQTVVPATTTTFQNSGLLVQSTNAGTYDRNRFTAIPEFGATLGYQLTRRMRLTAGYSLIYMGNVVRPGDQIDPIVNPNLISTNPPPTAPLRPQFEFVQSDYWVQGLSFGGEFRW